mgnify:FL=1
MKRNEIRIVGSGGQGVILATVILAEAAVLAGKYTAQSQSYGPEARGGLCKAETLIDDRPIGFTKVQNATLLLALFQTSLNQYAVGLSPDCQVVIDSSLKAPDTLLPNQVISLPILQTAREVVGKSQTANIVALGVLNELLDIAPEAIFRQAVLKWIPKGTDALNIKAFDAGHALAKTWKKEHIA